MDERVIAIDQQGGKSNCGYAEDVMMTLCSDSHGTPHALCYETQMNERVKKGDYFPVESFGHDERSTQFSRGGCCDTLTANDYKEPMVVCYGICSFDSNSMKSDNPHSGIYEAKTSRTLDLNGGNPSCNQGGCW